MKKTCIRIFLISCILCIATMGIWKLSTFVKEDEVYTSTQTNNQKNTVEIKTQETSSTTSLLSEIESYMEEYEIDESMIAISIFDLANETSYEINVNQNFISASLYKVPLAMLYYEKIEEGSIHLEDTLPYVNGSYEEGGPIGYSYQVGDQIPLSECLYAMIVYSDNTAAHILFEHLGGWESYRTLIQKYSSTNIIDSSTIAYNVFPASFAMDVLKQLYNNTNTYQTLIEHMKLVYTDDYLNRYLEETIAQKYGTYELSENAMGIVYGDHPYLITILSTLGSNGTKVIGDINEIAYNFFLEK